MTSMHLVVFTCAHDCVLVGAEGEEGVGDNEARGPAGASELGEAERGAEGEGVHEGHEEQLGGHEEPGGCLSRQRGWGAT